MWCSLMVLQGVETETLFDLEGERLVEVGRLQRPAGSVSGAAPPDDIIAWTTPVTPSPSRCTCTAPTSVAAPACGASTPRAEAWLPSPSPARRDPGTGPRGRPAAAAAGRRAPGCRDRSA